MSHMLQMPTVHFQWVTRAPISSMQHDSDMPSRLPYQPMNLGNMRSLGVRSLAVTCELCHHEAVLLWLIPLTQVRLYIVVMPV